jgi:hypothetical protein
MRALGAIFVIAAAGCLTDNRASRDRGGGVLDVGAPVIKGPTQERCAAKGKNHSHCDEAKYLAELYVKKLSPGDAVCLEGGFGEEPRGDCLARATVSDTATDRVLIEMREAKPDSRWFQKESNQFWFEEGALVDLYLVEHGY